MPGDSCGLCIFHIVLPWSQVECVPLKKILSLIIGKMMRPLKMCQAGKHAGRPFIAVCSSLLNASPAGHSAEQGNLSTSALPGRGIKARVTGPTGDSWLWLSIGDVYLKYTIRAIVYKASCHHVIISSCHCVVMSLCHHWPCPIIIIFNIVTNGHTNNIRSSGLLRRQ